MSKSKDKDIFLKVLEANKGIIYKIARAYCRNDEERKDIIQEIIIQIWNSFNKYNDQYKYSTWIYRIALNVAISWLRKNSDLKNKTISISVNYDFIDDSQTDTKEEDISLLYRIINEFNVIDKALMLLYLEQKSHKEIAEILDISQTNVATKIGRLKKVLKNKFLTIKKQTK